MDAEELLRRYAGGDRDFTGVDLSKFMRSLPSLVEERNPTFMMDIQLTNEEVKFNCAAKTQPWAITDQSQYPHR
jgi:hypothetical protein